MRTSTVAARALCALVLPGLSFAQQPSTEGYPAPGAPPIVTLVTPGAEPRTSLRWKVPLGASGSSVLTMAMTMSRQVGANVHRLVLPTMKLTLDWRVTGVSQDGDITMTQRFTRSTVEEVGGMDPDALADFRRTMEPLTAAITTVTMSDRGVQRETHVNLDAITDPQARERASEAFTSMKDVLVPWPEEPVGVGARWTVRQTETTHGIVCFMSIDHELLSIEGPAVTIVTRFGQTVLPQALAGADTPVGQSTQVRLAGSGSSKSTSRLDSMHLTSEGRLWYTTVLTSPDEPEETRLDTEIRLSLLPMSPDESRESSASPATATDRQVTREPVRAGGAITPPVKVKNVAPQYSQDALRVGLQGVVTIEATIDSDGRVAGAKVLSGPGPLRTAALSAVKQWRFTPTLVEGQPVSVVMTVTVNFTLEGTPRFILNDLLSGLRHKDEEIREAAARALGRALGNVPSNPLTQNAVNRAVGALSRAAEDKSERVRKAAAEALVRIQSQ